MLNRALAAIAVTSTLLFPPNSWAIDGVPWIWDAICGRQPAGTSLQQAAYRVGGSAEYTTALPCAAAPVGYHRLQQATAEGNASVDLAVGSDPAGASLCYVYNGLPEAPVIRVQRGHALTIRLTNTLQNTGPLNTHNCLLQTFVVSAP